MVLHSFTTIPQGFLNISYNYLPLNISSHLNAIYDWSRTFLIHGDITEIYQDVPRLK